MPIVASGALCKTHRKLRGAYAVARAVLLADGAGAPLGPPPRLLRALIRCGACHHIPTRLLGSHGTQTHVQATSNNC
jgi:hypothetical protein